jgi:hypothetical protein
MGVKKSDYIKEAQEPNNLYSDAVGDLLGMDDDQPSASNNNQISSGGGSGGRSNDLLDFMGDS